MIIYKLNSLQKFIKIAISFNFYNKSEFLNKIILIFYFYETWIER